MWDSPFWSLTKDLFWVKFYWLPNTTASTSRLSDFKQIKKHFRECAMILNRDGSEINFLSFTNSQLDWMYVSPLDMGVQNTLFSFADTDWQLKNTDFQKLRRLLKDATGLRIEMVMVWGTETCRSGGDLGVRTQRGQKYS